MAITFAGNIPQTAKLKVTVTPQGKVAKTRTAQFRATATAAESDVAVGLALASIGYYMFAAYANDPSLTIRDIGIDQEHRPNGGLTYLCSIMWSSETPDSQKTDEDNPLAEPVKKVWSGTKVSRALIKDRDGNPIVNKAKDAFDPPFEGQAHHAVLTCTKNLGSYVAGRAYDYIEHVNSTTFAGAPAGTMKCTNITATEEFKNGISYWQVVHEFEHAPEGWQLKPLNQGYYQIVSSARSRILDGNKQPVSQPVPLDNSGVAVAIADLPGAAVFLSFDVLEEADFNALGLGV